MKYTTYDISVTLKPITIKLEVPNETSCEEMHDIILEEIYRKLDSHNPEVHLDKVCLRIAKE
jgi:quinolinate synthase